MSYNQNIDRMFIEYKVYRRVSDLKPFISRDELPSCQMIGKKKFVGKKAKMEAVYRLTGEPIVCYGVERINDLQLLRELVNYRPKKEYEKGNYDSLISFGLALLQAEYNEVRGIIPKDIKENKNFSQKNAKLMLRSRFSHSNLKKLLNANNIQQ